VKTQAPSEEVIVEPAKPIRTSSRKQQKQEEKRPSKEEIVADRKRRRQERDVPGWLLAILGLLCLTAIGFLVCFVMYLAQKPRDVKVPNLKGVFTKNAMEQVKALKLNIRVAGKESNERVEIGKILKTNPDAGQLIREGGTISVYESSGTRMVKVPDLTGMTADEAKVALEAENLRLDGKPARLTDYENAAGTIIKQMPKANEQVARTSKILIWIAAPSDAPQGSLPGESDAETSNPARSFQLDYKIKTRWSVSVRVEMEDEDGLRTVLQDRDYGPGDTVSIKQVGHGASAKFKVYLDSELKDTIEVKAGAKSKN
jgi:hypothetical protein